MTQTPSPESFQIKWRGDILTVTLKLDAPRKGRAAFRTNIGHARIRRREIIDETEKGETPLARAWADIPLFEKEPGTFSADIPLNEIGIFSGKACFFPEGSNVPEWPEGANAHIKVESSETRKNNSIYTVFPRQFGSFREVARRLPVIMDQMGFRIIQTLPPFPVPTTYAVMGEYGCPFAATDFLSADPAMAEFDEYATPLDQFKELIDAVHMRLGLIFIDLPANHTGWASTLQTHHPDWFHRAPDGRFISPGAWGVTWADLVQLDYSNPQLRAYIADVFLFWSRLGVDGFRCDAGYMIPLPTWEYIVARVRREYPDTVFMLEGLGGELSVTDKLLTKANLDWAYSEIFQIHDRGGFEWYLPGAIARSETFGTLVHFAETHDNDRLAKGGKTWADLRVKLAALLSWQGAWGIANGVEWYCAEKIDLHGKNGLNWGAGENMIQTIAKINRILDVNPLFSGENHLELVTRGEGNTLAVLRSRAGFAPVLVLANLDCGAGATIDWDRAKFAAGAATDLLADETVNANGPISLRPGEVKCLATEIAREQSCGIGKLQNNRCSVLPTSQFHWVYPQDASRNVCVPEEQWVEFSAGYHFRVRLIDPETGMTLRVQWAKFDGARFSLRFDAPHYKGDGTHCRVLTMGIVVYTPGKAQRRLSKFLIPPKSRDAKVKLAMSGEEVRHHPEYRTILSNGSGAASQVRLGWGHIASQYDAFLAANPNPNVPSDRINLWTRTRCWLQREGYARELDCKCVTNFTADPAGRGAKWDFHAPCGMGNTASFSFTLTLSQGDNAARLRVVRYEQGETDVGDQVRLVFRPDIEWRSFHSTTKAFSGAEKLFPEACTPRADGVRFSPYDGSFDLSVTNGVYHHEPQWEYAVWHPEEAARGLDGSGDLFSPGWISADLKVGDVVDIIGVYGPGKPSAEPSKSVQPPRDFHWLIDHFSAVPTTTVADALHRALDLFIVRRDELKTVIAGYPWFLDWGRDTFIFMRGMIAAGKIADSMKILKAFAAFEENGTLPNIIYGSTAGNRDTTDAQLWFIQCVKEISGKSRKISEGSNGSTSSSGSIELLEPFEQFELLKSTCESIVDNYIKGTPNGIRMDSESALIWSPSHFTWMDTNHPACTPRTGYPVEIQALWVSALNFLGRTELAEKAKASVVKYFKAPVGYYDCLAAPKGESAAQATPEDTIRPNQLFLITLGILDDTSILTATEELLVPGGIRSLNAAHPLYRGRYEGHEDTSRKRAYHNGTAWGWVFPLYAEAMAQTERCGPETALQILASAVENINAGCLCHMSEIADGDAPHAQKGCAAQAWSDSELLRVWLKLGGK